jgi:DNA helicase-2/ATP-dependent DNA helicase PcrA
LSKNQSIFLVGDPNQAIYGFQGASPELISSIVKDNEWKKIFLNVNYRSTKNILNITNSFLEKNQEDLIKNILISKKSSGPFVKRVG